MTAIHWNSGINGTFDTAFDWSTATIPGLNDDALIDASGAYTVTSLSNETIVSLSTAAGATLEIDSGSFAVGMGTYSVGLYASAPLAGGTG